MAYYEQVYVSPVQCEWILNSTSVLWHHAPVLYPRTAVRIFLGRNRERNYLVVHTAETAKQHTITATDIVVLSLNTNPVNLDSNRNSSMKYNGRSSSHVVKCKIYKHYLITPWCRVLLEQLTGLQLVKNFPAFHRTRRFITALTSVRHRSILDQPNPVHIPTSQLLEIRPNIIHPSTPRSSQWSLSLRFPTKTLYTPLLTHTRHMASPSHSSRFYHPHNIG
jgi:hypothetical protein